MRVRYLGYAAEEGTREANKSLTVGGEYVVLAISHIVAGSHS